jgi:hypothetical protein
MGGIPGNSRGITRGPDDRQRHGSRRFLYLQVELDYLSALLHGNPMYPLSKLWRYVELNYVCHDQSPHCRLPSCC